MATRAPPSEAPPAYAPTTRYYRGSLRPAMLLITAFGSIYAIAVGASFIKNRNTDNISSEIKLLYLVLAVLYLLVAAIEVIGIFAVYRSSIRFVRYYFYASAVAALIVTAAELLRLVTHFTDKSEILATCNLNTAADNPASSTSDIEQACKDSWTSSTYWDVGGLLVSTAVSFFFASLAASYLHQLLNPQTMRTHQANLAPSNQYAYPLPAYPPPPPAGAYAGGDYPGGPAGAFQAAPPYVGDGRDVAKEKEAYERYGEAGGPETPYGEGTGEASPFGDGHQVGQQERGYDLGSTDTVALEPRRQAEGRV